jgi:TonB family protein
MKNAARYYKESALHSNIKGETIMKTLTAPAAYGYQELRQLHQRYMMLALIAALLIQFAIVGGYYLTEWLKPLDPPMHIIRIPIGTLLPPPSTCEQLPNIGVPIITAKFGVGIPIPVPEYDANPDKPFAGQDVLVKIADQPWELVGEGKVVIDPSVNPPVDPEPLPGKYMCIERPPEVIMTSVPEYPDLAKRIGLDGSVTINVLVDKEGKVKKVLLMKSTDDVFIQPALDAAKKWVFTPAIMNGKPVPVWVAIPFRFRLSK